MAGISPSLRLALFYLIDWVLLIGLAVAGAVIGNLTPKLRPFSLTDPNISYPFLAHETVPNWLLYVLGILVPVVVIVIFIAGSAAFTRAASSHSRSPGPLRKLWQLHVSLLGLATSFILALFITSGIKTMIGKQRPDFLARCQPDLSQVSTFLTGGLASASMDGRLVSTNICTTFGSAKVTDGLRSFPSGHASASAAGLVYLSLFLWGFFGISSPGSRLLAGSASSPFLNRTRRASGSAAGANGTAASHDPESDPRGPSGAHAGTGTSPDHAADVVSFGAPIWLVFLALVPTLVAIFVGSSRWFDYRHHGWDIIVGFFIGAATAFLAYGLYQAHMGRAVGPWSPLPVATTAPASLAAGGPEKAPFRPRAENTQPFAAEPPHAITASDGLGRNGYGGVVER